MSFVGYSVGVAQLCRVSEWPGWLPGKASSLETTPSKKLHQLSHPYGSCRGRPGTFLTAYAAEPVRSSPHPHSLDLIRLYMISWKAFVVWAISFLFELGLFSAAEEGSAA